MAKFEKGHAPHPGGGRPLGSKNKNYTNPSLWLEIVWNDVQAMDIDQRMPILKWAVEQILAKMPLLPATPGDSVSNAISAFQAMNGLASIAPPVPPPTANGNANGTHGER